jgi:hypothetical protein
VPPVGVPSIEDVKVGYWEVGFQEVIDSSWIRVNPEVEIDTKLSLLAYGMLDA